jgi:hypothetical protein
LGQSHHLIEVEEPPLKRAYVKQLLYSFTTSDIQDDGDPKRFSLRILNSPHACQVAIPASAMGTRTIETLTAHVMPRGKPVTHLQAGQLTHRRPCMASM